MHIDPVPGLHPRCQCGPDCEFPCWQQLGLVPDDQIGNCCGCGKRPAKQEEAACSPTT